LSEETYSPPPSEGVTRDWLEEVHFTPLPNAMVDCLCRAQLKPHDSRVLWCVLRKTLGYENSSGKQPARMKFSELALSYLTLSTGLDRRRVHEALRRLVERHIITVRNGKDRQPKTYGVNFDLSAWRLSAPSRTRHSGSFPLASVRNGKDRLSATGRTALSGTGRTALSTPSAPIKETLKENLKERLKESAAPEPLDGGSACATDAHPNEKETRIAVRGEGSRTASKTLYAERLEQLAEQQRLSKLRWNGGRAHV
jgi:phage replication O-like protein O